MKSHNHKNLNVWKDSINFVTKIYQITQKFPTQETYGLTSQLRRASVSIPANISEGATRNTNAQFSQFLYIAKASAAEVETLLIVSFNLNFISQQELNELTESTDKLERQIRKLIDYLK